jgi:hypothetical protein
MERETYDLEVQLVSLIDTLSNMRTRILQIKRTLRDDFNGDGKQ